MSVHDYSGKNGVARQGDVVIFKLPDTIKVNKVSEIEPKDGRLIVLEGEMTGHHHSIPVLDRPMGGGTAVAEETINPIKTDRVVENLFAGASNITAAVARMFKDPGVTEQLQKAKVLNRTDLYIGTLVIEGGGDVGVILGHQEHDGIRLTQGNYYIGRQVESAGAEERVVQD